MRNLHDDDGIHDATQFVCGQATQEAIAFQGGSDQVGDAAARYLAVELRNLPLPCGGSPKLVESHYEKAKQRVSNRIKNDIKSGAINFDPVTAITLAYYLAKLYSWLWQWMNAGDDQP